MSFSMSCDNRIVEHGDALKVPLMLCVILASLQVKKIIFVSSDTTSYPGPFCTRLPQTLLILQLKEKKL